LEYENVWDESVIYYDLMNTVVGKSNEGKSISFGWFVLLEQRVS
jgi:hypothetical protein